MTAVLLKEDASPGLDPLTRRRGLGSGRAIPEEVVVQVWDRQHLLPGRLLTAAGQEAQVLHPGWRAGAEGPDFQGARISLDGALLQGDVEVHLRARDWDGHGHGADPAYDRVVLHVCLWSDGLPASHRHDGGRVPILALYPYLRGSLQEVLAWSAGPAGPREPCGQLAAVLGRDALRERLAALGERRLEVKALRLQGAAAAVGWEQGAYEALLEGCGYSRNRAPFLQLARRLPVATLAGLVAGKDGACRRTLLAGLLLGAAGLLDAGRGLLPAAGLVAEELERLWAQPRLRALAAPGPPVAWAAQGLRPANHPVRRLLGAVLLLERHLDEGLLGWLVSAVRAAAAARRPRLLLEELVVRLPAPGRAGACLIGPERAGELAVNVALPLALAWGEERRDRRLAGAARRLFAAFPATGDNRTLEQTLRDLLGAGHGFRLPTARLQQGVLLLQGDYCRRGRCAACPLGPR